MSTSLKIVFLTLLSAVLFFVLQSIGDISSYTAEINGVSLVSPPQPVEKESFEPIVAVNANWVAIIPYAFSRPNKPEVQFDYDRQWWGEKPEGVIELIKDAQSLGIKVMLKPHVWVVREGWPGDFKVETEEEWKRWENDYLKYILHYTKLADSMNVAMLCIGTEYRQAVKQRPDFWKKLIEQVKSLYTGEITYATNWDNFKSVSFWDELDYIGVNAYFPLSKEKTPSLESLRDGWNSYAKELYQLHKKYDKPIIFTEFGYRSIDFAASGHWNLDNDTLLPNATAQKNALDALFKKFWTKPWIKGGFLWKWYPDHQNRGGIYDPHFTPQNKPAEMIVRKWYGNNNKN